MAVTHRASFDLKSATLPLIAVLLKTTDLSVLANALQARLGETPDFFAQDPVVVDVSAIPDGAVIDFVALLALLRQHRMVPIAVRGGTPRQIAAAQTVGLLAVPDATLVRHAPTGVQEIIREVVREVSVAAPTSMVVDKPLRSGQQVYARGSNLVVLAMVSHGAEVIADGCIHVYAPLRGKAIAGARGNTEARIFSTCMEPDLVSIAGIYRTTEVALPRSVLGKTAQVRLVGEKLLVEPL